MFGKCQKEYCEGVQINITDRYSYNPHKMGLCMIKELSKFNGFELKVPSMCLRYGNDAMSDIINFDPLKTFESELEGVIKFRKEIAPYLLYD